MLKLKAWKLIYFFTSFNIHMIFGNVNNNFITYILMMNKYIETPFVPKFNHKPNN